VVNLNRILFCIIFVSACFLQCAFAQQEMLIDPMRPQQFQSPKRPMPAAQKPVMAESWKLTTILTSTKRKVAVINGNLFQVGDTIDGYKVVEIKSDRVVLKKNKSKVLLRRAGTGLRKNVR
jgi:hypothetical protein